MTKGERIDAIAQMRAAGLSASTIGERFGITSQRVIQICRTYEIPLPAKITPRRPPGRPRKNHQIPSVDGERL